MPHTKGVNETFKKARRHSTGGGSQMTLREDEAEYDPMGQ